ncbi:DUF4035 domain-containing protein [Micromonospora sp. NPDC047465]|uniref:phage tail assembly protein T n=1 Tax=Micromonospora sp. NPDC047465 TaxID=3154813 RepID=UPI0033E8F526
MGELLARIDARELSAWMAYERVTGPLGPERADMHAAIIASTIANANRGKHGRRFTPEDFLPRWDQRGAAAPAGEQTGEDHLRLIRSLNKAMGGLETGGVQGGDTRGPDGEDRHRQ